MKLSKIAVLTVILFIAYILLAGSVTAIDLLAAAIASLATSVIVADLLVRDVGKILDPKRIYYLVRYFIKYMFIIEPRAHIDVIKRIISPHMPINPGIVAIPYGVKTDYAILTIANSITNTPGTVTVDVDRDSKLLFVHWIDVKAVEPEECRRIISREFEENAEKIFD
ncbi:MAG: Na+/H+ antiporter subunit E [Desulfurococcales archaeon]|nr:Na+/H+ antiporter subunit E [Desulfurococcales archaeon]